MDSETKNYVDARTEATRSQNEAQFARIMAKLEGSPTSEELRKSLTAQRNWIVGSAIALFTASVTVLAFGGDRFDSGVAAATLAFENSEEAREIADDNRKDIRGIKDVLEAMTENLRAVVAIVNRKDE